jgi:hypothetical protein
MVERDDDMGACLLDVLLALDLKTIESPKDDREEVAQRR